MKKLISLLCASAFAIQAYAQQPTITHKSYSFLNGLGWMVLSNNTTITYGQSNYFYISATPGFGSTFPFPTNVQAFAITTNTYTNVFTNTFTVPSGILDVPVFCDQNGNPASGTISVWINSTNFLWHAPQNLPATNYPALVITPNVSATNIVTFTFARATDALAPYDTGALAVNAGSGPGPFGTTAQDKFTFSVTGTGTTELVVSTNLPTSFLQGAKKLRLLSVTTGNTNSSSGFIINSLTLNGFAP